MKTPFDTYFENLRGKRVAVLGLGVSNRPLVRLLLEYGCTVCGGDRTQREKLDEEVLELEESDGNSGENSVSERDNRRGKLVR